MTKNYVRIFRHKAFTLLEVLVVSLIIGVLAAVAVPVYNNYFALSKEKVAKHIAATIAASAATYYSQNQEAVLTFALTEPGTRVPKLDVQLPADYQAELLTSEVIVKHRDNTASATVFWK